MSSRTLLAAAGLLALTGCGRSGPNGSDPRPGTLTVASVASAGSIVITLDGQEVGTCPGTCSVDFEAGSEVSLLAQPDAANHSGWVGDASGECAATDNPCVFVPSGETQAGALWTATLTIDAVPDGYGRVLATDIDCADDCVEEVPFGAPLQLDADAGSVFFLEWGGACADAGGDVGCELQVAGDASVVATFSLLGGAVVAGSTGNEYGESVTPDPQVAGGFFIAGTYDSADFSFLGNPLALTGTRHSFLSRVSPAGASTWIESYGGAAGSTVEIHAIAADTTPACYAAGSVTGTVDLEQDGMGVDAQGVVNGFVLAQPLADTEPSWVQTVVGAGANARSIFSDIDSEGTVLGVVGMISDDVDLDAIGFDTGDQDRHQLFTAILEEGDGDLVRAVRHGDNTNGRHTEGTALEFAPDGDPYVAGFFDETFDDTNNGASPCSILDAQSDEDPLAFRLNGADFGQCAWPSAITFDLGGEDRATGIAEDGTRVVIPTVRIDSPQEIVIRAVTEDEGLTDWSVTFAATDAPGPFGIDDDADRGELVLAGSFRDTITIDGDTYTSAGGLDVIVVRLDADDGQVRSVSQLGGAGDDVVGGPDLGLGGTTFFNFDLGYAAGAVSVLDASEAVIAGWTTSTSFAGVPTSGDGSADLFVIRAVPAP